MASTTIVDPAVSLAGTHPRIDASMQNLDFLRTASKTVQLIGGILLGIVGVGSLGIGITMYPFSREMGGGAMALSTALFAAAGVLLYNAFSPAADLSGRSITQVS